MGYLIYATDADGALLPTSSSRGCGGHGLSALGLRLSELAGGVIQVNQEGFTELLFGLLLLRLLFQSVYRLLLRLCTLARPGLALALETEAIANPHLR